MAVGFFTHQSCLAHDPGAGHPERPERLSAIHEQLVCGGLWDHLTVIQPKPASEKIVKLVHTHAYVRQIAQACRRGPTHLDADTVAGPGSWEAALLAAGAVIGAVDRVVAGELSAAFCAVRPPGHHAMADRAMGFCLFNNVAIGARYAQKQHGLSRILIVDWDAHHGNGTQAIFFDDPSVFYFSTHRHPFYPQTGSSAESGAGAGRGFTVNVPLAPGSGDSEIVDAFKEHLLPKADKFKPDLVFVSAGFDAHRDDPLGGLSVTEAGYAALTRQVRAIAERHCQGRLVSVLEGGYNLQALASSTQAHLRALME